MRHYSNSQRIQSLAHARNVAARYNRMYASKPGFERIYPADVDIRTSAGYDTDSMLDMLHQ